MVRRAGGPADPVVADLLGQLEKGPKPVRDLAGPDGRAGLLRRLRSLDSDGRISLEWTLLGAGAGPRYERWVRLTDAGRAAVAGAVAADAGGTTARTGRPLGPRQVDALRELAAGPTDGQPAADLSGHHGSGAVAGLVRRGLVEAEVRERPRLPLAARPAGRRGGRPPATDLLPAQLEAVERIRAAIAARDPRPLLLDGVTGGGKTAIYVEAIATSLEAGRPALVLVPEIALALPLVDRLRADLDARIALVHSGLGDGERADEWRRIRAGEVDIVVGTRLAVVAPLADVGVIVVDEEHDAAYKSDRTPRLQARDTAIRLARLAGAAIVLGSATPAVESVGRARAGDYDRVVLPARPVGKPPAVEIVDLRAELAAGQRGLLSRSLDGRARRAPASQPASRRSSSSTGAAPHRSSCAGTAVTSRPARTASGRSSTTRPGPRCAAITAAGRRRWPRAARTARRRGSATSAAGRNGSSARCASGSPALRVGRLDRDVVEHRGAAERVIDAFAEGRLDVLVGTSLVAKGLDIPSRDARRRRVVGRRAQPARRARGGADLPAARPGDRPGRPRRPARAGRSSRPTSPIIRRSRRPRAGTGRAFYDAELACAAVRVAAVRAAGQADGRAGRPRPPPNARRTRWPTGCGPRATERGVGACPSSVRPRPTSPDAADRWRWNVVLRGDDPVALLDGGVDAPWSVDVDPESLL